MCQEKNSTDSSEHSRIIEIARPALASIARPLLDQLRPRCVAIIVTTPAHRAGEDVYFNCSKRARSMPMDLQ